MKLLNKLLFLFTISLSQPVFSTLLTDSILEIPRGTEFELQYELDIPANRDFILIGKNHLNETFNEISQSLNEQKGRPYHPQFSYYNDDETQWLKTAGQSYRECLERHRVYYHGHHDSDGNNVIVNKGNGNTNIIIDTNTYESNSSGSYIANNSCIRPEHTLVTLLIDSQQADTGGIFRSGYQFKVESVRHTVRNGFHIVTIGFDHLIATGINIITTESPENIQIYQLQQHHDVDGFWNTLGSVLAGLTEIGGGYFNIKLPEKQYFD